MMRRLAATLPLCLVIVTPAVVAAASSLLPGWEGYARQALSRGECSTAKSLAEQAIAASDPVGFVVRAEMYETGRCAPRQPSKAVRDYAQAARRGSEVGYARLGSESAFRRIPRGPSCCSSKPPWAWCPCRRTGVAGSYGS